MQQAAAFLIEVSDFPQLHTCVKQMIMLLESFTVTLRRWIWGALSHHANVAALKKTSLPWMELFLQHLKERLAITDRKHSSLVNVNSPLTIAVMVIIICLGYNGAFNSVLSIVGPSWGLRWHCAATLWLIETYHHYWTVSAVT